MAGAAKEVHADTAAELARATRAHARGPLVAFVNTKSGGKQGAHLLEEIARALGDTEAARAAGDPPLVRDIVAEGGPAKGLTEWSDRVLALWQAEHQEVGGGKTEEEGKREEASREEKSGGGGGGSAAQPPSFRVLVCGGDGSVGWVLGEIDRVWTSAAGTAARVPRPAVAVLPLGTGNDLARTLEWGGGYAGESIAGFIARVNGALPVHLDRWAVTCEPRPLAEFHPKEAAKATKRGYDAARAEGRSFVCNNYFSIGADAEIALGFHELREKHSRWFAHRVVNKGWYGVLSGKNAFTLHGPLSEYATLSVDGVPVPLPASVRGIVVTNLPSWAAGANLWGDPEAVARKNRTRAAKAGAQQAPAPLQRLCLDDGLVEVAGLTGVSHIGAIRSGMTLGKHLGQGRTVRIATRKTIAAQVDGEPWGLPPCIVEITHLNTAEMLFDVHSEGAAERLVACVQALPAGVATPTPTGCVAPALLGVLAGVGLFRDPPAEREHPEAAQDAAGSERADAAAAGGGGA